MISNVLSYLEGSVRKHPDRIAVSDCNQSMTYCQLWNLVSAAGSALYARTGQTNRPIAVCIRHELSDILSFTDAFSISDYAFPALQWACGSGLINGSGDALMPSGSATRAQAAAILHRFISTMD